MPMPRGLVLLASLWIFASWQLSIGLRPPAIASVASYLPGVRLMIACLAVGLCAGWPLLRLSGARERWPMLRVLVDLVARAHGGRVHLARSQHFASGLHVSWVIHVPDAMAGMSSRVS